MRIAAHPDPNRAPATQDELHIIAKTLGNGEYQRHIFLCAGPSEPKCCSPEVRLKS